MALSMMESKPENSSVWDLVNVPSATAAQTRLDNLDDVWGVMAVSSRSVGDVFVPSLCYNIGCMTTKQALVGLTEGTHAPDPGPYGINLSSTKIAPSRQ